MKSISNVLRANRLLPLALVFVAGVMLGTAQSFAGKTKEGAAAAPGKGGKTVFVDVSALGKKDRAAKRMTKQHQAYAKEGWTVANIAVYTENGDLEGFFITYVKQ
ncbi:MAG: hypothetical protein OES46_18475 [Gammaproteobacteria bacterium]|jgi:hypothetical protein|nr:hypothetical protein [Gammaproteobacteria bacterium]